MTTKAEKKALSDAEIAEKVAAVQQAGGAQPLLDLLADILERLAVLEAKK